MGNTKMIEENMSRYTLSWLIEWYANHCNGDLKQNKRIQIETIDNPGWSVFINLNGTELENKTFNKIKIDYDSELNWLICFKEDKILQSACGPCKLQKGLSILEGWLLENSSKKIFYEDDKLFRDDNLSWLVKWYSDNCDGDWEHDKGVCIYTTEHPGWSILINLEGTQLENKKFNKIKIDNSNEDWLVCFLENNVLKASCSPYNLLKVLHIFRSWMMMDGRLAGPLD